MRELMDRIFYGIAQVATGLEMHLSRARDYDGLPLESISAFAEGCYCCNLANFYTTFL